MNVQARKIWDALNPKHPTSSEILRYRDDLSPLMALEALRGEHGTLWLDIRAPAASFWQIPADRAPVFNLHLAGHGRILSMHPLMFSALVGLAMHHVEDPYSAAVKREWAVVMSALQKR